MHYGSDIIPLSQMMGMKGGGPPEGCGEEAVGAPVCLVLR